MISEVSLIEANSESLEQQSKKEGKIEILFVSIDSESLMNLFVIPYIFVK